MSNYTILQRNVLDSLASEQAKAAFLWACDLKGADRYQYKAEAFAREVDEFAVTQRTLIDVAADNFERHTSNEVSQPVRDDLMRFHAKLHAGHRLPDTQKRYADSFDFSLDEMPRSVARVIASAMQAVSSGE